MDLLQRNNERVISKDLSRPSPISSPSSPFLNQNSQSKTVNPRCSSASLPQFDNSKSSFSFETPKNPKEAIGLGEKLALENLESSNIPFYSKNYDNISYYHNNLKENVSNSVPLLSVEDKSDNKVKNITDFQPISRLENLSGNVRINNSNQTGIYKTTSEVMPRNIESNKPDSHIDLDGNIYSSAFSNDELTSPTKIFNKPSPTKKFSASPTCQQPKTIYSTESLKNKKTSTFQSTSSIASATLNPNTQPQTNFNLSTQTSQELSAQKCGVFRIFAKRLNENRMVLFLIPKDVKTLHLIISNEYGCNALPVFAYHCDRSLMAKAFAETTNIGVNCLEKSFPQQQIIIENFCNKAEMSTLAQLRQQITRKRNRDSFTNFGFNSMELFYATGGEVNIDREEPMHTLFDLANYCEVLFEEYIYTKSFIVTIYACLGQEIFVPSSVLLEVFLFKNIFF